VRILFYKPHFAWPRASGHDVHTYEMMRAMGALGARVALATAQPVPAEALTGIDFEQLVTLDSGGNGSHGVPLGLKRSEERFRSYWGIPEERIAAFGRLAADINADAVVVSGLDVLPLLGAVSGRVRVWYAGDEWAWHHLSQVHMRDVHSWSNVKDAAIKGLYERAFRGRVDRAWAVSELDAQSLRWIAGIAHVDTIPNGVDASAFTPCAGPVEPETAVFWGRLDFGPNVQALEWFVRRVWPRIRRARPAARFTIVGFRPEAAVTALARVDGVELRPDVPDVRPEVARHAVVVLPFVSGAGIKNKLLEAAAMAKPIVASPRALTGLRGDPPLRAAQTPAEWVAAITALWDDEPIRRTLGVRAREWVRQKHGWRAAAQTALAGLEQSLAGRNGRS
jgi:polysaccharide biosynthesis protein PslH